MSETGFDVLACGCTSSADVDVIEVPVSASCMTQVLFSIYLDLQSGEEVLDLRLNGFLCISSTSGRSSTSAFYSAPLWNYSNIFPHFAFIDCGFN